MQLKPQWWGWRYLAWVWLAVAVISMNESHARPIKKAAVAAQAMQLTTKQEMSAHTDDLRNLMLQLYTAHPDELAKSSQVSPREMTEWVFDGKANWRFEGIRRLQGDGALALLFDPAFAGDHILALVVGLETRLFEAYGSQNEFDIPAQRDQSQLATLQCELQSLPLRLQANATANPVLSQGAAHQQITATLHTLLLRLQASTPVVTACP